MDKINKCNKCNKSCLKIYVKSYFIIAFNDENRGYLTLMLNFYFTHIRFLYEMGFQKVETFPFQKIPRNLLANKTQVTPVRAPGLLLVIWNHYNSLYPEFINH